MDNPETKEAFDNITKELEYSKKLTSELYKKLDTAKTEEECKELVELYKNLVDTLKNIRNESFKLDGIQIHKNYIDLDNEKYKEVRMANCNEIQAFAQQMRGCIAKFQLYNDKIKNA